MIIKSKYLPIASGSDLGAIKIGSGLSIDGSGVASVSGVAISSVTGLTDALSLPTAGLTGFPNRTDSTVTMNSGSLQIAPVASTFSIWSGGVRFDKTTESVAISNDNALNFVYYTPSGVLSVSTTAWDLTSNTVPVHMVYRYGSLYKRYEERHSYIRNRPWHEWAHDTIGTRYHNGLAGNSTFSIASGAISDEDIDLTIAAATSCTLLYRATGATYMAFENNITTPYKVSGGNLQYDNAGTLTNASNNNFVPMWVYGTNAASDDYPIHIVVGQAQYATVAGARNAALPVIPAMQTREWKLLYRTIYQQTAGGIVYTESADYREVSTGPGSSYTPAVHNDTLQRDATSAHPATSIDYDNITSGYTATNVQDAIDEIAFAANLLYSLLYSAQSLDSPLAADWAVASNAAISNDSSNSAITVRLFGDAAENGAGTQAITVPTGATSLKISIHWRAVTAPGSTVGVVWKLYHRSQNSTVSSWSSQVLTTASVSNTNWLVTSQTTTLSTLGITAGDLRQFELTRTPTATEDTLTGNAALESIVLEFA